MSQPTPHSRDDGQVVPVVEEVLEVQTQQVETGGVRVRKTVQERDAHVDEAAWREEVQVERVAINRVVDGPAPTVRTEGEVIIVPVLEEIVIVQTQLVLKEEVRITKRRIAEPSARTVRLRREEATVERFAPGTQTAPGDKAPRSEQDDTIRKESSNGENCSRSV